MNLSHDTDWQCDRCTLINNGASLFCDACGADRIRSLPSGFTSVPTNTYTPPAPPRRDVYIPPPKNTGWECKECTVINNDVSKFCGTCGTKRKDSFTSEFSSMSMEKPISQAPPGNPGWECKRCTVINNDVLKLCGICGTKRVLSFSSELSSLSIEKPTNHPPQAIGHIRAEGVRDDEIRIVLIGKTGSGKSATGNTILGFPNHFESLVCGESITKKCKRGEAFRFGKKLMVVDTPGLFDTGMTNQLVTQEIVKCIGMTSPGPHAIVLVVQIGRFTKEEKDTVIQFADNFGEGMYNYLIVLFTRKDDLDRQRLSIDEYVTKVPEDLKQILGKCGQRYIAFDNIASHETKERDSKMLLSMIEEMVQRNGGSFYSNEMYNAAEDALKRRMLEIRRTEKEKKDREIKEIQDGVTKEFQKVIDQEIAEKIRIQDNIEELKEERRRDKEKAKRLDENLKDLHRQRERDEQRLKEEQEEARRQQKEFMTTIKQQQQANNERDRMRDQEIAQMKEKHKEQAEQAEKLKRKLDREKEINQEKEEERQNKIKENERKLQENAERERQRIDEMQREQKRRERQREEEYRRNIEAERVRGRARDECEKGDKNIFSKVLTGVKSFFDDVKTFSVG